MKPIPKTSRRIPESQAATEEEIVAAIEDLTPEEENKLLLNARTRISVIGKAALGRNEEDLFNEAITATLGGVQGQKGRRWNKSNVTFFQHLVGAMKSISSHWLEALDEEEADLETDLHRVSDEGENFSPMLNFASNVPSIEREIIAREQVERLENLVRDRTLAALILGGMRDKMNGTTIKELLELSQTQLETEKKWIFRVAREDAKRRGSYV